MKTLFIIFIAIVISSCCSPRSTVKNAAEKQQKDLAEVIKPETSKTTPFSKAVTNIPIIQNDSKLPIVETEKIEQPKPPEIVEVAVVNDYTTEAFKHNLWNDLLQKHVTEAGNVNYKGFKNNRKALTNYISSLGENRPNTTWSREDKLAYWINAYNAMTIDLIVRHYPIQSIKDIKNPWEQRLWKLGEKWYNLDDIEHQILRKMNEPRIHFGIVCASFSCPKLQNEAFTAFELEEQLTKVTRAFLSDDKRNNISENSIKLSKIFKWFSTDFETNGSVIDFINKYSEVSVSNKAKKSFKDYNWDLNE